MPENFEVLEWDSNFFGFLVAMIGKNNLNSENQERLFEELAENDIKLGYYFSNTPLESEIFSEDFNILLVDKKVPLVKKITKQEFHPKVSIYEGDYPNENLIRLAQQAGIHTRFNIDPNIPRSKYQELFKIWIEKSVTGERATDVLVYKQNNEIIGFATIQLQKKGPYVSLLAVQKEYEGKGVSFALMNTIENILINRGHSQLFGATQLDNRKAMVVYRRYGSIPQPVEYIYHIWRK